MSLKKKAAAMVLSTSFLLSIVGPASAEVLPEAPSAIEVNQASTVKPARVEIEAPENTTFNVGETVQLNVLAYDEDDVEIKGVKATFKTDNTKVIGLKGKSLVAVGVGSCNVYATISGVTSEPIELSVVDPNGVAEVAIEADLPEVISKGESYTLTPVATNADGDPVDLKKKKLNWKSSDTKVITVDNKGKITAKGVGSAEITLTIDGITSEPLGLEVKDVGSVATVSIAAPEEVDLGAVNKGDVFQLSVSAQNADGDEVPLGKKKIVWKSSNAKVAAVDNKGKVTAKGLGDATITATIDGVTSEPLEIAVKDQAGVETVEISADGMDVLYVGDSYVLVATAYNADGDEVDLKNKKLVWQTSDAKVIAIDQKGKITAKKAGSAMIICTIDGVRSEPLELTVEE